MTLRTVATPLTIASFIVVTVTGLFLFLGLKTGYLVPVHEWSSILFVAGSILHLAVNWKATLAHLRRPLGATLACLCTIAALAAFVPRAEGKGNPRKILQQSMALMLDSDLQGLAAVTRHPEAELRDRLERAGFRNIESGATLRAIARANGKNPLETLAAVI